MGSKNEYPEIEPNKLLNKDGVNYFYFTKAFLVSKNMFNLLNQINPALIYLNSFWSFNFSVNIIKLRSNIFKKTPILLAPRGMLSKGALSIKAFKKSVFIFMSRNLGWHKNVIFHATNPQEKNDVLKKFKNARVLIAPNVNAGMVINVDKIKSVNHLNLFFLSRISPVKNLHFALQALQLVPEEIKINYDIFGNIEDENYWQECTKIIKALPKNITVSHKVELPFNEVQTRICNYHFLFLPTLNENFGHSIVESLLSSCPVIISDQTPWSDCQNYNAGFALPVNMPKDFTDKLVLCAKLNQEEYNKMSCSATQFITEKINITENINAYKKLFNESINN